MYIILFIIIHFIFFQNKMLTFMNTNSKSSSHVFSQFLNYFNFIPWYNFVVLKAGVKTVNYVFIYHYFVTLKWVHWLITKVSKCVWCVFIYYFQLIKITNSLHAARPVWPHFVLVAFRPTCAEMYKITIPWKCFHLL